MIAVESEREFGLSVLQRLDVELKRRGDMYREPGVQDLAGYREARPDRPCRASCSSSTSSRSSSSRTTRSPRRSSLLLDRLVRQGRAFGIHVILGSQTLGGAYSLARSTLGQMAVRIALQCSEADAHLILSEDNTAARLLTRPGEAIYNDANGMIEGNNLFQVVWLSDERREEYLPRIQELARGSTGRPTAADRLRGEPAGRSSSKNPCSTGCSTPPTGPSRPRPTRPGSATRSRSRTRPSAVFRPQSGSNLLIDRPERRGGAGMMTMAGLSLAAQHAPPGPASRQRGPLLPPRRHARSTRPTATSAKLGDVIPHPVKNVRPARLAPRSGGGRRRGRAAGRRIGRRGRRRLYLMVYDLQRFRDLRKGDDDFGFSSSFGEDESRQPVEAVHRRSSARARPSAFTRSSGATAMNNLNRTFDRQTLARVRDPRPLPDERQRLQLPDRLARRRQAGPNRALFFSEEKGSREVPPLRLPDDEWLTFVRRRLRDRPSPNGQAAAPEEVAAPAGRGDDEG